MTSPPESTRAAAGRKKDRPAGVASLLERIAVWLAALVVLLFVCTLRDVAAPASTVAPAVIPGGHGAQDAVIEVVVRGPEGELQSDVQLQVYSIVGGRAYLVSEGRSDSAGRSRLEGIARGQAWVIARHPRWARASRQLALMGGVRQLELSLSRAEQLQVVVVDTLQRPIRGVSTRLYGADPVEYQAITDERGLAEFTGLGAAPYAVEVTARGFESKFLAEVRPEDSPLFVKLEQLGVLEVFVEQADGKPAAGVTVAVAGSALWPARRAETNAVGQVTISGLPRGFYDLRAVRDAWVNAPHFGVLLERGEHKEVRLKLLEGRHVRVTVSDGEGETAPPLEGAAVALVPAGVSSFPLYGRTDASGAVVLGPIGTADATVSARAEGFVARSAVVIEDGAQEVHVALLRGGVIAGRVVDEEGYPIEGSHLEIIGVASDGMPIAESSRIASFRDDHFSFALPGAMPLVPAGELGLMPIVPDVPRAQGPLLVMRSQRTNNPWLSRADGSFTLKPVSPGRVRVVARHPQFVEAIGDALLIESATEATTEIVLRRGGMLEGRVLESDRSPVPGARVELSTKKGTADRLSYAADDGSFAFAALPSEVTLSVSRPTAPEHVAARLTLEVPPGKWQRVEVVLPAPRESVRFRVTDDRGFPLGRVEIRLSSLEPDVPTRTTLFTDDGGEASAAEVRGLPLRIVVMRRHMAPNVVQVLRAPAEMALTMIAGLEASGLVMSGNTAVKNAELHLLTPTGTVYARSDESGRFQFRDLAPGPVRMLTVKSGFVPDERGLLIQGEPGKRLDLGSIALLRGGVVEGEVVDDRGDPIRGARVASGRVPSYLPIGALPLGISVSNKKGRFRLTDLAAGLTSIEAHKLGFGRAHVEEVRVRSGETTTGIQIVLGEDSELSKNASVGMWGLAVTLGDRLVGGRRIVRFEHVPMNGEAQRAGIQAGDILRAYNGVPVRSMQEARRLLTGPRSQDMVLSLARGEDLRWRVRVRRERLRR